MSKDKKVVKKVAKKTEVLNESIVRRFMTLSNLKPLTPGFIKRLSENSVCPMEQEEEMYESGMPGEDEEGLPPEMGMDDDLPGEEEPVEGGDESTVKTLVDAIASAIESVSGVEVNVSGGEGDETPPEAEVSPEPEMEPPAQEEEEEELDEVTEPVEEKKDVVEEKKDLVGKAQKVKSSGKIANTGKMKTISEAMIQKVAQKVAARLMKESKKPAKK